MNLTLVTDSTPDQEPVSLAEAKAYLRQDSSADDETIQSLITAARLEAENENGRECSTKQWLFALDRFPPAGCWDGASSPCYTAFNGWWGTRQVGFVGSVITLLDPLVSVDAFEWTDDTNTPNPLVANTDYIVDLNKHPGIVCPTYGNQWPAGPFWPSSAVQITFTAGFGPDTIPGNIKQGIMMLVSQWYEARIPFEAVRFVAEIPFSVTSLFRNNKLWKF